MKTAKNTELLNNQKVSLKSGQKFKFSPTGVIFVIGKVTEKRVSWYLGFEYQVNKNTMRMTSTSMKIFQEGLEDGTYELI